MNEIERSMLLHFSDMSSVKSLQQNALSSKSTMFRSILQSDAISIRIEQKTERYHFAKCKETKNK